MNSSIETFLDDLQNLIPPKKDELSVTSWFSDWVKGNEDFELYKKELLNFRDPVPNFRKEYEATFAFDEEQMKTDIIKTPVNLPVDSQIAVDRFPADGTFTNLPDNGVTMLNSATISTSNLLQSLTEETIKKMADEVAKRMDEKILKEINYKVGYSHATSAAYPTYISGTDMNINPAEQAAPASFIVSSPSNDIIISNGDNKIEIKPTGEIKLSGSANIDAQARSFWKSVSNYASENYETVTRLEKEVDELKKELENYRRHEDPASIHTPGPSIRENYGHLWETNPPSLNWAENPFREEIEKVRNRLAQCVTSPPPIVINKSQLNDEDLEYLQTKIVKGIPPQADFLTKDFPESDIQNNFEHAMELVE